MVLRSRYAIMANRWFAGWLQEETFISAQLWRVEFSRAELAARGTFEESSSGLFKPF